MTNEKTIRVMGTGHISVQPDTTWLRFDVESLHEDYEKAYIAAAIGNADLRDALKGLSIDPDSLKTVDFKIRKKFESVHKENTWKEVFVGFELRQTLRIELPIDGKNTSLVLFALGKAWPDLEVDISYVRKDVEQAKLDMLESAVKDAKKKATVMASALGYCLGDVISIDYSRRSIDINYREDRIMCCGDAMMESGSAPSLDITPEDVEAMDTVETVWTLK